MRLVAATGRALRALLALAVLAGFTAGVPWLLTTVGGWPLGWIGWPHPADVPSLPDLATAIGNPWSDQQIMALLATLGWLLWAQFCRDLVIEGICACLDAGAAPRGARRTRSRTRGPIRMLAALLIGAIIGITASNALRGAAGATGSAGRAVTAADDAAQTPAVATATAHPGTPIQPGVGVTQAVERATPAARNVALAVSITPTSATITRTTVEDSLPEWARNAPGGVYRVVKGDNLWDIAEHHLGDPHRWREIYLLNRGHPQPNGSALTDPDEIDIGWVLMLPATGQAPDAPGDPGEPTPAPANPGGTGTEQQPAPSHPAPSPSATAPASPQPPSPSGSPEASAPATAPAEQAGTTPTAGDSGGEHRDHDQ
ncbi:MAG: LysM peptidoglycan-binding domain-containing protein, partial [Micromonosporaceae bacterium]|nr:LysM peptidoglycan-binding domain-containing protein [Micromonosporaceae bacterium]